MSQKAFSLLAGTVFLLIAFGHLLRIAGGWTFVVDGLAVPMWASVVALAFAGYLAYEGIRLGRKSRVGT